MATIILLAKLLLPFTIVEGFFSFLPFLFIGPIHLNNKTVESDQINRL